MDNAFGVLQILDLINKLKAAGKYQNIIDGIRENLFLLSNDDFDSKKKQLSGEYEVELICGYVVEEFDEIGGKHYFIKFIKDDTEEFYVFVCEEMSNIGKLTNGEKVQHKNLTFELIVDDHNYYYTFRMIPARPIDPGIFKRILAEAEELFNVQK